MNQDEYTITIKKSDGEALKKAIDFYHKYGRKEKDFELVKQFVRNKIAKGLEK